MWDISWLECQLKKHKKESSLCLFHVYLKSSSIYITIWYAWIYNFWLTLIITAIICHYEENNAQMEQITVYMKAKGKIILKSSIVLLSVHFNTINASLRHGWNMLRVYDRSMLDCKTNKLLNKNLTNSKKNSNKIQVECWKSKFSSSISDECCMHVQLEHHWWYPK